MTFPLWQVLCLFAFHQLRIDYVSTAISGNFVNDVEKSSCG